jgi:hypothetical protein
MLQAARKRVPALCGVSSFDLAFLEQLMILVGLSPIRTLPHFRVLFG